jgi:transketolase
VRQSFIRTLCDLAAADERIILLTGDLGYTVIEPFRERFPERFINVGVAEQNMIAMATGLAEAGFLPYAYSIATFAALRAFEFIRNGPVMHGLPVRVVGVGTGFEYGPDGLTHHALEDLAVLRNLPGLTIVAPADSAQATCAVRATAGLPGPVYYGLSKDERLPVSGLDGRFELGRIQLVCAGPDLAILSVGPISTEAVAAADLLSGYGIAAAVAIVSNFNPDPAEDLAAWLADFPCAISVETQTLPGALAAMASGVIASRGLSCKLYPLGVRNPCDGTMGSQQDRWRKHGLDRDSIVKSAVAALRRQYT